MITLALCFFKNILFLGHKWRNPFQRENTTRSQGRTPTPKQTKKSALKTKTNWWLVAPLDLRPSLAQIVWWGHHFFSKSFLGALLLPQTWVLFLCCAFFSPFAGCVFHFMKFARVSSF
jgi:hypothetical protein